MSTKRLDLQGIRGLAIIAVLGFHFYPKNVPNGYLGVDQFFVLSGFLMCMLLTKSENMSMFSMVSNFYIRRFKRILPLYELVIFLSLVFLYSCFPDAAISQNENSAKRALIFMSNRLKTDQESYFEMLSIAVDIFTHTWSLSVEIQFYFLAPFIFLLPLKIPTLSIIFILSYTYFYNLPSNIAFFNVFARIWQFMIGMISYNLSDKYNNEYRVVGSEEECEKLLFDEKIEANRMEGRSSHTILNRILTMCSIFLVFYYQVLPEILTRPIVTILTGALLIISDGKSILLSNSILTYIGDISYSLYLIHWPLYSYWKLTQNEENKEIMYLMISILVSILIYHIFEQWYTKLSNVSVLILVVLLSLSNLAILNQDYFSLNTPNSVYISDGVMDNMTLDDAMKLNRDWNAHDYANLAIKSCIYEGPKPLGWCNHTGLNPSNKYKIMLIGNSWVANHAGIIYDECKGKANTLFQGSAWACEPLYATKNTTKCHENLTDFEQRVMDFKPDYAFHITRHISYGEKFIMDFDHDPIYKTMLRQMRILTKYIKKKLYILDALPWIIEGHVQKIVDNIKRNMSFVEIDKKFTNFTHYAVARKRYAQLFKDCGSKCERIDYHNLFYQNETNTYRFFDDRGFTYFTSSNHLSPHGLERVRHIYRDICDKL